MTPARARVAASVLGAWCLLAVPVAHADGDPASDVLIYAKVFPSYVKLPQASVTALTKLVDQANARGYTVRVALIGDRFDLGSVPVFWLKPQPYAKFLSQELLGPSPYTNRVLVAMPNGFGLSRNGKPLPAERRALDALPTARASDEDIAAAAFRAVQRLAALRGVELSGSAPKAGGGRGTLIAIVAAAFALVIATAVEIGRRVRRRTA
jgi:hypothetical protein